MNEIAKRDVIGAIENRVVPLLGPSGFDGWSRKYEAVWRSRGEGERTDTIKFSFFSEAQCKKWRIPAASFSVEAGCFFEFSPSPYDDAIRKEGVRVYPDEPQCHLRMDIAKTIFQLSCRIPNIWCVNTSGRKLERVIRDVIRVTEQKIVPWFDQFDDLKRILNDMINDPNFNKRYKVGLGVPAELPGFIALRLKKKDLARRLLAETLKSDLFLENFERIVYLKHQIERAIEET